jgi:hypothetical protein
MLKKVWHSPTIMTWMSYSTKALALFGLLPLILKLLSPGDIVLWYLFSTIISLQSLADFGFRQTFSRIISYAFAGASDIGTFSSDTPAEQGVEAGPNMSLLNQIVSMMNYLYRRLTVVLLILMGTFGTWSMMKPIKEASNQKEAWISWAIVLVVSCISFYGKLYMNFLEGLFKIALVRRVEAITSIGTIVTSIIVLFTFPSLLNLIIANQAWALIVMFRDWYLCVNVDNGIYKTVSAPQSFCKETFLKIWKPAWRSGISGLMSNGLTNLTGLVYAQLGNTSAVASYLLALRIINQIKEVSMAPFYSKLPLLAILRVKNDMSSLLRVIMRGMFLSHVTFIAGFIVVGLFSTALLSAIHSEVHFVDQSMWMLLGAAFFVHRYGAMHIQVYLSTNHIISHIADGISGILYIISSILLSNYLGVYSIPIGMLIGYFGFYAWYSAKFSYKSLGVKMWIFEKKVAFPPLLLALGYVLYEMFK